jgi:hypothetical protein
MDDDLDGMPREQLIDEVRRLRQGIREQLPQAPRTSDPFTGQFPTCWSISRTGCDYDETLFDRVFHRRDLGGLASAGA